MVFRPTCRVARLDHRVCLPMEDLMVVPAVVMVAPAVVMVAPFLPWTIMAVALAIGLVLALAFTPIILLLTAMVVDLHLLIITLDMGLHLVILCMVVVVQDRPMDPHMDLLTPTGQARWVLPMDHLTARLWALGQVTDLGLLPTTADSLKITSLEAVVVQCRGIGDVIVTGEAGVDVNECMRTRCYIEEVPAVVLAAVVQEETELRDEIVDRHRERSIAIMTTTTTTTTILTSTILTST